MSDRVKGFVVTLEQDLKDDDAERLESALAFFQGVVSVDPVVADASDLIDRNRIRWEIRSRVLRAIDTDDDHE